SVIPKRAMFLHRRELHVLNNQRSGRDRERAMRAKACFVMAVVLFWSASVFSQSFTIGAFETGNKLLEACSDGHHDITQGYCKGYRSAVFVSESLFVACLLPA